MNLLLRRTHLYLGMLLIPWLLIYGLSTAMFNHPTYFRQFRPADPQFLPVWEKDYSLPPTAHTDDLREMAQRILADNGISGPFGVQRQGERLNINVQNFIQPKRLTYDLSQRKLRAEQKKFAWTEVLMRLHFRAGYNGGGFLAAVWPVVVDVFCLTLLIWIITGLYLWWKVPRTRMLGWATIFAGAGTISVLLATL